MIIVPTVAKKARTGTGLPKPTTNPYALRSGSTSTRGNPLHSLAKLERELAEKERALAEKQGRVAATQRALAARERQLAEAEAALRAREQRLAEAEAALRARELVDSKSPTVPKGVMSWLPPPTSVQNYADQKTVLAESVADVCDAKTAADAGDIKSLAAEYGADEGDAKTVADASDGKTAVDAQSEINDKEKQMAIDQMIASWQAGEPVCVPKKAEQILIKVQKPDGPVICFNIKSKSTLKKLMLKSCEMLDLDQSCTKFFLELRSTDRACERGLTDGAVLQVLEAPVVDRE